MSINLKLLALALLVLPGASYAEFSKSVGASYSTDLTGSNPVSSFNGSLSYKWTEKISFAVSQSITKRFFIYPNQDEFSLSDTVLSASYSLGEIWSLNHRLSLSGSLPISEYSRDNDRYSTFSLSYGSSHSPVEKLNLSYGLSGRLFTSRYQSEISGDGRGGFALPVSSFGISHSGSYQILDSLSATYSLSNTRVWYYDLNPDEALAFSDVPDDTYSASLGISYSLGQGISISTGFAKGNLITQIDSLDLAIFDAELSQWYINLSYSF